MLIILVIVAFIVLLERTLLGSVQIRTGPINVRYYGVVQTVVDRIKLLNKGMILNNFYSRLFLIITLLMVLVTNKLRLFVILLRTMILIYQGILVSNNIYSKMGRYRIILLSWRYDLIILFILVININIVFVGAIYYVLSCEVRRTPVDLVEGESELVSRYNTEYAGGEFVRFFLGEYMILTLLLVLFMIMYIPCIVILYRVVILIRRSYPRYKYGERLIIIWKGLLILMLIYYIL